MRRLRVEGSSLTSPCTSQAFSFQRNSLCLFALWFLATVNTLGDSRRSCLQVMGRAVRRMILWNDAAERDGLSRQSRGNLRIVN